mgnify:CR=1 FL=1
MRHGTIPWIRGRRREEGEDRGEPRRSTGRVAEAPVGEALVSAGLLRIPDLAGDRENLSRRYDQ